jgi:hypothetical protein
MDYDSKNVLDSSLISQKEKPSKSNTHSNKDEKLKDKRNVTSDLKLFRTNTPLKSNRGKFITTPLSERKITSTNFPVSNSVFSDKNEEILLQNSTIQHQSNKCFNSLSERSSEIKNKVSSIDLIDFTCFFNSEINNFMKKVVNVLDRLKILHIVKKNNRIYCHKDLTKLELELIMITSELSYIKMKKTQGSMSSYTSLSNRILVELSKQQ